MRKKIQCWLPDGKPEMVIQILRDIFINQKGKTCNGALLQQHTHHFITFYSWAFSRHCCIFHWMGTFFCDNTANCHCLPKYRHLTCTKQQGVFFDCLNSWCSVKGTSLNFIRLILVLLKGSEKKHSPISILSFLLAEGSIKKGGR